MYIIDYTKKEHKNMWKQRESNKEKEKILLDKGVSRIVSRLLSQRDIDINEYSKFIDCKYEDLTDPYALNGIEQAVKIFAKNLAELPSFHPEAGGKPWLMIDEIIVE